MVVAADGPRLVRLVQRTNFGLLASQKLLHVRQAEVGLLVVYAAGTYESVFAQDCVRVESAEFPPDHHGLTLYRFGELAHLFQRLLERVHGIF